MHKLNCKIRTNTIHTLQGLFTKIPVLILGLILLLFSVFQLSAQTQSDTIKISGTWTVPSGITEITVEAWGAGGGGGNSGNNRPGGGGGAYAKSILNVQSGTEYAITIGEGGSPGNNGGISAFGVLVVAAGGKSSSSSNGGAGGLELESTGQIKYKGGNGANAPGGGGSSAGIAADGNDALLRTGGVAPAGGGKGGSIPSGNNQNGEDGHFPGGGAAGRSGPGNGAVTGSGADGLIIITYCQAPQITNHPSNQTITYGSNASFSVSSGTTGVTYQWQVSTDNGQSWQNISGAVSSTLNLTLPTVSLSGNQYRCMVSKENCGFSTSNTANLTVNPATILVTAGNQSVIYGTPASTVTQYGTYSLSGFINGDNSSVISGINSIAYTTSYTSSTNAGTPGVTITPNTSGLSAANYSFSPVSGTISVNKADQFIICGCFPFTKPLNEFINEPVPLNITASSGLPVIITIEAGSAATLNYNINNTPPYFLTDIGETGFVTIHVNQPGDDNYNPALQVTRIFDVTKSNQSISFPVIDDIMFSNGLTVELQAVASSGLDITYSVSGPATVTGNTLNITGAGEFWVTASQEGNASYNPASNVTRSFTVGKGTQSISINVPAELLTSSTQITAYSTSGLDVSLSLGTGSDATALIDQGTYYTLNGIGSTGSGVIYIVGNQAGNDNFLPADQVIQIIDLTKQNQVITFPVISNKTYGDSPFSLNAAASSGLTVAYSIISGPASLSGSTLTITGAGTVIVEASQGGNSTYNPAPSVTRQFEVIKASPVISQTEIVKTFGDADFPIEPISTNSPGSFSFVSGNTEIFTLSGNTATIIGAGSTVLNITQQPTANYFGAVKSVNFTVNKANSTISVTGNTEFTYNALQQGPDTHIKTGSTGTVTYSYSGTGSTTYGPSSTKPVSAGTYSVTATVAENNNYSEATSAPFGFTIQKANPTIVVNAYTVTYNGNVHTSTGSATGVASENLAGLDLSATSHINAGTYSDNWTFTDATGNYNDASGTVENTIIPKELTITALNQVKCYGVEFIFSGNEFTASGLISGETIGSVSLASSGAGTGAVAGNYSVVASIPTGGNFNPANYTINYINGQLTVKPLPTLSTAAQSAIVCEGSVATINISGLLPEKIFSLDYSISGIQQPQKTGLYSDAFGVSSFTTTALTAANNGQTLKITGITITSETPGCSQTFSTDVILSVNPLPTLTAAELTETVIEGFTGTINLSGLLANTTFTVYYTIDEVDQTPVIGILADVNGNAVFNTPILTTADNGKTLRIYGIEIISNSPSCYQEFTQDIVLDVIANTFYLTMAEDASACHDLSGNILDVNATGNTTLIFTVNLNKVESWTIDNWNFDFTVNVSGSGYTLQSVKVNNGSDIGTGGNYTDQLVAGTSANAFIEVVVNGPVETTANVTVTVSNGEAVKGTITTPDNGTGDKTQILTVDPLPSTSTISFD